MHGLGRCPLEALVIGEAGAPLFDLRQLVDNGEEARAAGLIDDVLAEPFAFAQAVVGLLAADLIGEVMQRLEPNPDLHPGLEGLAQGRVIAPRAVST